MDDWEKLNAELRDLRDENTRLRDENSRLQTQLAAARSGQDLRDKARSVIIKRKEERLADLQARISRIVHEDETISTKELIQRLEISNKTFYNLNLDEYFSSGLGI